jgi:hypothetical protein
MLAPIGNFFLSNVDNTLLGKSYLGGIALILTILVVIATIVLTFGFNLAGSAPKFFTDFMNVGGIFLIMFAAAHVGVALYTRVRNSRKAGLGGFIMNSGTVAYGGSYTGYGEHPYYITGSNENTKTVSDNYLPTI